MGRAHARIRWTDVEVGLDDPKLMPRAVAIAFWNGDHLSGSPLHIALWPSTMPPIFDSLAGPGNAGGPYGETP